MSWTADDIGSLDGTTAVVTGPDSGIGYHVTKQLARHDATVYMASKTREHGDEAREKLEDELESPDLTVVECDLGSLDSIAVAAETMTDELDSIDILCNNAGVMALPYQKTDDGFEYQIGVNHLGHFALTLQLIPLLDRGNATARVICQSSGMHERGSIDPADLLYDEEGYDRWQAYADSKLANLLFAYELDRRTERHDLDLFAAGTHPGYADTSLQYRGPQQDGSRLKVAMMKGMAMLFAQSPAKGALPMLYAATQEIKGQTYWGPDGLWNMRGHPVEQESSEQSYDDTLAAALWDRSEELTGMTLADHAPE